MAHRSSVCVFVRASWLKGGVAMGVAYRKNVHNFIMDLKVMHLAQDLGERLVISQSKLHERMAASLWLQLQTELLCC